MIKKCFYFYSYGLWRTYTLWKKCDKLKGIGSPPEKTFEKVKDSLRTEGGEGEGEFLFSQYQR